MEGLSRFNQLQFMHLAMPNVEETTENAIEPLLQKCLKACPSLLLVRLSNSRHRSDTWVWEWATKDLMTGDSRSVFQMFWDQALASVDVS
jgi:hypothetical protein